MAFYAPEVWRNLDTSDSPTTIFDTSLPEQKPIIYQAIAGHGDDVVEWRDWNSDELARRLRDHAGQPLILAVVWSGLHFHAEEKAAFRNIEIVTQTNDDIQREFFQSLDLSRPDLAAVRKAAEDNDWPAACAALADYYRQRTSPLSTPTFQNHLPRVRRQDLRSHLRPCRLRTLPTRPQHPVERRPLRLRTMGYRPQPPHALAKPRGNIRRHRR